MLNTSSILKKLALALDKLALDLISGSSQSNFPRCEYLRDELNLNQTQPSHLMFKIKPLALETFVLDYISFALETFDPRNENLSNTKGLFK